MIDIVQTYITSHSSGHPPTVPPGRPIAQAYRPDIDGLRALAIIAVICYHFVLGLPGGYIGVDVFFVISGYLITLALLARPPLTLSDLYWFWWRRVRRLLPALLVVTAATISLSVFVLMPAELEALGASAWRALCFTSNYLFVSQASYFDAPSLSKPLLHTWSLAVEGQFYIVFALLMGLLLRWIPSRPRAVAACLVAVMLMSLCAAVLQVRAVPSTAFYTLPTRLWEFIPGSLLALGVVPSVLHRGVRFGLQWLGLCMIVGAALAFDQNTRFPGEAALLPVLGAALLIHTRAARAAPVSAVLETGTMKWIGKVSYSLYLWHWPMFVLATFAVGRLDGVATLALSGAVLVLSVLSYHLVEQPFNNWTHSTRRKMGLLAALLTVLLGTLAVAALLVRSEGWPGRLSAQGLQYVAAAKDVAKNVETCHTISPERAAQGDLCSMGPAVPTGAMGPVFVVWGDSHAHALFGAFSELAREHRVSGRHGSRGACPPLIAVRVATDIKGDCRRFNEAMVTYINRHDVQHVFLVARWSVYTDGHTPGGIESGAEPLLEAIDPGAIQPHADVSSAAIFSHGLDETLAAISRPNRTIYLVTGVPEATHHIPFSLARSTLALGPVVDLLRPRRSEVDNRQQMVVRAFEQAAARPGVRIVSMRDRLCDAVACQITDQGHSLYRDADHLSAFGANVIQPLFEPLFQDMERQRK